MCLFIKSFTSIINKVTTLFIISKRAIKFNSNFMAPEVTFCSQNTVCNSFRQFVAIIPDNFRLLQL